MFCVLYLGSRTMGLTEAMHVSSASALLHRDVDEMALSGPS